MSDKSISQTLRAMKPGQHFDYPLHPKFRTIPVSSGATQVGAQVITRTSGEGCERLKKDHARVWLVSRPDKEGRSTELFTIGNGIKIPKGTSRGRPAGVANAPKGAKASKAKAKAKTSAKVAPKAKKAPSKASKPAPKAKVSKAKTAGKGAKLSLPIAKLS